MHRLAILALVFSASPTPKEPLPDRVAQLEEANQALERRIVELERFALMSDEVFERSGLASKYRPAPFGDAANVYRRLDQVTTDLHRCETELERTKSRVEAIDRALEAKGIRPR